MASSSSTLIRSYDVFLSFRGEDTRTTITDHLFHALKHAGIHTFRDDEELKSGSVISSGLLKAIQESKISIVVFSKNYATSSWCLDELVEIIECNKVNGQIVFPVFYHVDPSHVRKQTQGFADAFVRHEQVSDKEKVKTWRAALQAAASFSGFHLQTNQPEAEFVRDIVEKVLKVIPTLLPVPEYPVGLDSRVQVLKSLLGMGRDGVHMIGIYGIGGIGKTTVAKGLYNFVSSEFDYCCCFLQNIRARSEQPDGLVLLQEQLLLDAGKIEIKIRNVEKGVSTLIRVLSSKRVFIVLDDLENIKQLKALAGQKGWFGSGSRIVITTRDQHLLDEANVDERCEIKELDQDESLELFICHAFGDCTLLQSYMGFAEQIVSYTKGLPLALEVLGSSLINRDQRFWETTVDKLKEIPPFEILETLQLSFDSLDDKERDIFLDIACCFEAIYEEDAFIIFEGCGFYPAIGIPKLIDRCLLKKSGAMLTMHDLLREMGREIVRQEDPKRPEKRSRLWRQDDVCHVLRDEEEKKAAKIEGIILELSEQKDFNSKAFERVANLRLLQINHANLNGNFQGLFKKLRWFCWHHSPLESLPPGFNPAKLLSLDMQKSKIRIPWQGIKSFGNLKLLNLSGSEYLETTPDFTGVPNLMELSLKMCPSLSNIHPSIGCLHKLIKLYLTSCVTLKSLPSDICGLKSLELFHLDGCSQLEGLPEQLGSMKSLRVLLLGSTAVTYLPDSIGNLGRLQCLNLACCYNLITLPSSIHNLTSLESLSLLNCQNFERLPDTIGLLDKLQFLYLDNCYSLQRLPSSIYRIKLHDPQVLDSFFSLKEFHKKLAARLMTLELSKLLFLNLDDSNMHDEDISYFCCLPVLKELSSLERLTLSRNMFSTLPVGLGQLPNLKQLALDGCSNLQTVLELPHNLRGLVANNCTSLEKLPDLSYLTHLKSITLENCSRLADLQGLENLQHLKEINTINCMSLGELANLSNITQLHIITSMSTLERNIFLDIACFFRGYERDHVTLALDSCGFEPIHDLIKRSIVTIDSRQRLQMDNLFRDMGQRIARESYADSRLWLKEEISEVMRTNTRLEAVEAIYMDPLRHWDDMEFDGEIFRSMKKLRLLHVNCRFTSSNPTHLPDELRCLTWEFYPFDLFSLLTATGTSKLAYLDMKHNDIRQLSFGETILHSLKFINLTPSFKLTRFPDISGAPNLERLNLSYCYCLVEVHESVGSLKRLVYLNLSGCNKLKILPSSLSMESLQTLILSHCESLESLPEISGDMGRLSFLDLSWCSQLKELPSFRFLTGLTKSDLLGCGIQSLPNTICELKQLRPEEDFPSNIHKGCSSLQELALDGNTLTCLPASICHFSCLKVLKLNYCFELEELTELPSSIQVLEARHCTSLRKIGDLSNKYKWLYKISFFRCPKLLESDGDTRSYLANFFRKSFVQKCAVANHRLSITIPGREVPDWFLDQQFGNKIALKLPPSCHTTIQGFAICFVLTDRLPYLNITFQLEDGDHLNHQSAVRSDQELYVWVSYIPFDMFHEKIYHDMRPEDWSHFDEPYLLMSLSSFPVPLVCGGCIIYKEEVEDMPKVIEPFLPDCTNFKPYNIDSWGKYDIADVVMMKDSLHEKIVQIVL